MNSESRIHKKMKETKFLLSPMESFLSRIARELIRRDDRGKIWRLAAILKIENKTTKNLKLTTLIKTIAKIIFCYLLSVGLQFCIVCIFRDEIFGFIPD